jgi:hypothetical protein
MMTVITIGHIALIALAGMVGVALLSLAAETAKQWVKVADMLREVIKAALLDIVQVYAAGEQARLDVTRKSTELDYSQDFAAIRLQVMALQAKSETEVTE